MPGVTNSSSTEQCWPHLQGKNQTEGVSGTIFRCWGGTTLEDVRRKETCQLGQGTPEWAFRTGEAQAGPLLRKKERVAKKNTGLYDSGPPREGGSPKKPCIGRIGKGGHTLVVLRSLGPGYQCQGGPGNVGQKGEKP